MTHRALRILPGAFCSLPPPPHGRAAAARLPRHLPLPLPLTRATSYIRALPSCACAPTRITRALPAKPARSFGSRVAHTLPLRAILPALHCTHTRGTALRLPPPAAAGF